MVTDAVSQEMRNRIRSRVRLKDMCSEIAVYRMLWRAGLQCRVRDKTLFKKTNVMGNWITTYDALMVPLLWTVTLQVGERCYADEVRVKISGNIKYLFAMMDGETRFVLAQEVASKKP